MKNLVIYYSYSGNTKKLAVDLASKGDAVLCEIKDKTRSGKRPNMLKTFLVGCPRAISMKAGPIQPISVDLNAYDRIIVMAPVWASHPAPPVNNIWGMLPAGKEIEVALVSESGHSAARDKIEAKIKEKSCTLVKFEDIKTGNR